ncbi:capsid protein [Chiunvirus melani]|uniref:Capsid protein n=1 Tax=Giant panda circovirus 1 TaxID=2016456 RepID=A0A220IGS1_9CIRC|nr:capsid protein [Giant panda circovirus 1]ASH99183.1 capsid protein [Giant panda circovirus 1]
MVIGLMSLRPRYRRRSITPSDVASFAWRNRRTVHNGILRSGEWVRRNAARRSSTSTVSTGGSRRSSLLSTGAASVKRTQLQGGATERTARVKRYGSKLKKIGRRRVKVSRKLRAKIIEVTDGNKIQGYYQDNRIDVLDPGALGGRQNVEIFPNRGGAASGYMFNYDRVLHAASRLWNTKAAVQNPVYSDALNFSPNDTVINVEKQWWTFELRNNSTRTATLKFCKMRMKRGCAQTLPYDTWVNGLAQMTTSGELVGGATINTMFTMPTLSTQFKTAYKLEVIKVVLEPGQSYTFNIEGPAMTYHGQDFFDNGTYRPVQKQDTLGFVIEHVDMVGTHATSEGAAGNAGFAPDTTEANQAQERVYMRSTYHCRLNMPEKVGGISTAAASIFQNGNRVRRTCVDEFMPTTFATTMHRRDEENPVVDMN